MISLYHIYRYIALLDIFVINNLIIQSVNRRPNALSNALNRLSNSLPNNLPNALLNRLPNVLLIILPDKEARNIDLLVIMRNFSVFLLEEVIF